MCLCGIIFWFVQIYIAPPFDALPYLSFIAGSTTVCCHGSAKGSLAAGSVEPSRRRVSLAFG
jgi:hypothetical protein